MTSIQHGMRMMVAEHLSAGDPITRLEALTLYGVQNLPEQIRNPGQWWGGIVATRCGRVEVRVKKVATI